MKKTLFFALFAGIATLIQAALAPPAGYKEQKDTAKLIFSDDFREGMKNWSPSDRKCFSVLPTGGVNGSAGVAYTKTNPKKGDTLGRVYHFKPGVSYRASVSLRMENPQCLKRKKFSAHTMYIFHHKGKQYVAGGSYPSITFQSGKNTAWQRLTIEFLVPPKADTTYIKLGYYAPGGVGDVTGKIIYDDFQLEKLGEPRPELYPVYPKSLRLTPDRKMKIRVHTLRDYPAGELLLRVVSGKFDRTVPVKNGFAELTLPELPLGKHLFEYQLLNQKKKLVLGTTGYTFQRLDPKTGNFKGRTELTADNRLLVDGKPFFLLKMSMTPKRLDKTAIIRMKEAGLTALMPYSTLTVDIEKKGGKPSLQKIRTCLDFCQKTGIKVIMCLKEQIHNEITEFEGVKGAENISAYVVEKLKTHPAILAWYVADENPLSELPRIMKLRERISHIDPWHPVIVCVCKISDLHTFCQAGDMMFPDWYPINNKNSRSMSILRSYINPEIGIGTWFATQAFCFGALYPENKHLCRFPTEEEMRSLALLALNCGAKGLSFFSYSMIFIWQEQHYPGSSKWFWPQVVNMIRCCRNLEEFFLNGKTPEKVSVTSSGKNFVEAKLYRNGKKVCVIVTGDGPGKADALLSLPKGLKFRSLYGHTVPVKDGAWRFTGTDICSDVLLAER